MMKMMTSLLRCPLGGQCFNPVCMVFGCINHYKPKQRIIQKILLGLVLMLVPLMSLGQLGCAKWEVEHRLQNEETVKDLEIHEEFIYLKTTDESVFMFNFKDDVCLHVTAFIPSCSTDLIHLTKIFAMCQGIKYCKVTPRKELSLYIMKSTIP